MSRFAWFAGFVLLGSALWPACGGDGGEGSDGGRRTARDAGAERSMPDLDAGGGGTEGGTGSDAGMPPDDGGGGGGEGGAAACPAGACNLITNEGCAAGEACQFVRTMPGETPAPMCIPAGTGGDGASCDDPSDCREGFACDAANGVCRAVCCGMDDASCPIGQRCIINIVDEAGTPQGWGMCKAPDECDILMQSGCPSGQACYPAGSDASVLCAAPTPGAGMQGDDCDSINACTGGFICISMGGASTCRKACSVAGGEPACPMGLRCVRLNGSPEGVGVCADPA